MFFRPSLQFCVSGKLRGVLGGPKTLTGMGGIPYFNFRGNHRSLVLQIPPQAPSGIRSSVASDSGDGGGGRVPLPDWQSHHLFADPGLTRESPSSYWSLGLWGEKGPLDKLGVTGQPLISQDTRHLP